MLDQRTLGRSGGNVVIGARKWLKGAFGSGGSPVRSAVVSAGTALEYGLYGLLYRRSQPQLADAEVRSWVSAVRENGYHVVPDFLDQDTCRSYRDEIDRVAREYPRFVHHESDERIFGIERGSALLRRFGEDERLLSVAEGVLEEPATNAFMLGARLDYSPGNKGSGEGWHRDSCFRQFKAIVYLTDVEEGNGPFQYIQDSEKLRVWLSDVFRARLGYAQNRFTEDEAGRLLEGQPERLHTFLGKAGTLLLANVSGIHRGQPIQRGTRYSLFNYYFPTHRVNERLLRHFEPFLVVNPC